MEYGMLDRWVKTHKLVRNRVSCCESLIGGIVSIRRCSGEYLLECNGRVLTKWRPYDLDGVKDALLVADTLLHACWEISRAGLLVRTV